MAERNPLTSQSVFLPTTDTARQLNILERGSAEQPELAANLLREQYNVVGSTGDALNVSDTIVPVAQVRPFHLHRNIRHEVQQPTFDWGKLATGVHGANTNGVITNPAAGAQAAITSDMPIGEYDIEILLSGDVAWLSDVRLRDAANATLFDRRSFVAANANVLQQFSITVENLSDILIRVDAAVVGDVVATIHWRLRFGSSIISV